MSSGFNIIWHEDAIVDLKKLDKSVSRRIINKVKNNLVKNPKNLGKTLKGQFKGLLRYRVGDYRIIFVLDYETKKLIILAINHRKNIYR
jgi:mRNA interferase RelE/StbE